jgi:hypothetical protein
MILPYLGTQLLGARFSYPLSSTRHWITKSFLRPLTAGLRSNEYSSFEGHVGSESPLSEGSSEVKYDRGRRALPLPLPVDIIDFLPIPAPELSTSISTSTSEFPPPDSMADKKGRGRKKGNTADFIARAVEKHGDQYDYSLAEYGKRCDDKLVIRCKRHDPPFAFEITPANHLSGHGCRLCGIARTGQKNRRSTTDFIARAVEIHGDQYDYSLSEYGKTNADKVIIICKRHDPPLRFEMRPNSHLSGQGCRACGIERTGQKLRGNTEHFIARAVMKHGDLYDYSLSEYGKTNHVKVIIFCRRHDPPLRFEMSPRNHLQGRGCHACGFESKIRKR